MGQGVPFRAGTLDGAISVSALQWLCNADTKAHNPVRRLYRFFASLYAALVRLPRAVTSDVFTFTIQNRGTRAVFQFYPENEAQVDLITRQAMRAGFTGGLVVDYPNSTKAKK
jgi:18S rRNA (guanine1575-N7)-methyltransferase